MLDFCYLHLTPPDDDHYLVSSALGHIIFVEGVLGHGLFNILIGFLLARQLGDAWGDL